MNNSNYITFIKSVIVLILFIPILLFVTAVFKIEVFENLSKIADSISGITSPLIGILGVLLVFFTFEQQRFLINKEIEKEKNKNNNIRDAIFSDLKNIQYKELLLTKEEIEQFNLVKHDYSRQKFLFRETISLSANFIDSIPIQDLYEAFSDKSEFHDIIYIYKKIKYIEKYALNNLFSIAIFDYSGTIDFNIILTKHDVMLNYMPVHIQTACNMIQGLEYKSATPQ